MRRSRAPAARPLTDTISGSARTAAPRPADRGLTDITHRGAATPSAAPCPLLTDGRVTKVPRTISRASPDPNQAYPQPRRSIRLGWRRQPPRGPAHPEFPSAPGTREKRDPPRQPVHRTPHNPSPVTCRPVPPNRCNRAHARRVVIISRNRSHPPRRRYPSNARRLRTAPSPACTPPAARGADGTRLMQNFRWTEFRAASRARPCRSHASITDQGLRPHGQQ